LSLLLIEATMKTYPPWIASKLASLSEHRDEMAVHARQPIVKAENTRRLIGEMRMEMASMTTRGGDPDAATQAEVQRLEADVEAAVAEHVKRRERAIDADQALSTCRDWIAQQSDKVRLERAPVIRLTNGDSRKLLELVRRDIGEAQTELATLRRRPQERAEIAQQIGDLVARRARTALRYEPHQDAFSDLHVVPLLGLLCRVLPGEVVAALTEDACAKLDVHSGGLEPIGSIERAEAIAATEARLLEAGRQEEALIERLLGDNPYSTSRRRDSDPKAILGVIVGTAVKPKPAPAPPPSFEEQLDQAMAAEAAE
jgi:hypothetical protein